MDKYKTNRTMTSSLLRSLNIATIQVVTALFIQTCFVLGTIKSMGVFFYEFQDTLGITSSDIGISLGLFNAFTFGPGPLVAHLYRRGGLRRPLLLTGAILAPLGLILSSIITNNTQLAVCLSLGGLGGNILSQCLVTCLDAHAHDHFYTLFGISKSGYAFGMLISPLLAAHLMDIYGWRGAMLIMGAITCHIIPLTVMVDTNINDKAENVATSDLVKCHNRSEERSIKDRDRGDCSIKECSSMVTNGLNNDATVASENESVLRHTGQCQGLVSATVQNVCDEVQDTSLQQYKEPLGVRCPTTTATVSEQDQGDMCSESCSLMEINRSLQSPTHGRHQQGVNDLSSSGTDHPPADTTSKLSLKRIRRSLMDSVYNQDRCLIIILIANAFVAMLHGGWHAFFIPRAISRGKSLYSTLSLLYSTSIACFLSRIFIGVILTSKIVSGYDLFLLLRLVNVASMLVDIYSSNFAVMIVTSFITSIAINEENMFMIFVSKERSPSSAFPLVFAVMQISFGIGAFVGTYLTGMLEDITGSYTASFIFLLSIEGVIFFMMIPPRLIRSKFQKESQNLQ